MEKLLLNQSLVKDLFKYKNGELCGLILNNKWIMKQFGKGSKANDLGHYFEYLATGAYGKGRNTPPEPDRKKNGEITAEFDVARRQAIYFKKVIKDYGIKEIKAGEKVIADNKWIGTLDISARWDNLFDKKGSMNLLEQPLNKDPMNKDNQVIIDLKLSALLDDKWSEFGWDEERLPFKEGIILQAIHYTFLYWKKYGYIPPFFFFVFDSKNVGRLKPIYIPITEAKLRDHEILLNNVKKYLDKQIEIGFKPIPKYEHCRNCDYNKWCSHKIEIPPIIEVPLF